MRKLLRHLLSSIALLLSCALTRAADGPQWLTYSGGDGPGKGRHIVLIAGEQEYRGEQSMPMLAKILSTHHGFDCTVLFGVNEKGEVDPTMPVYPEKGKESEFKPHHIPGLEHLASADLVIFLTRLLTLPMSERELIVKYIDSGKPFIALRTANHGFRGELPYKINGKQVRWGEDVLGGTFLGHHGRWMADSTRGNIVEEQKQHPILTGVSDIWGNSDVYRTHKEGTSLPTNCTALVWGQPLMGRQPDDPPNPKLEPRKRQTLFGSYGAADEFRCRAVADRVHVHDFHATIRSGVSFHRGRAPARGISQAAIRPPHPRSPSSNTSISRRRTATTSIGKTSGSGGMKSTRTKPRPRRRSNPDRGQVIGYRRSAQMFR